MTGRVSDIPDFIFRLSSGSTVTIASEEYNRLVQSWTERGRRRPEFPRRLKARLSALHYILRGFKGGVDYTEEEVNATISERNPFRIDHVQLRRFLVDYGMLGRRDDGSQYRVIHTYLSLAKWDTDIPGAGVFKPGAPGRD